MEKEFGKLSRQQLRELFAYQHQITEQRKEISALSNIKADAFSEVLLKGRPWSWWYEREYRVFLAIMLHKFGMLEEHLAAAKADDPEQAALDLIARYGDESKSCTERYSAEQAGLIASLFFAQQGNFEAQRIFSQTMNELVKKAREDDDALFDAVLVDRSAVSCPSIAFRIQMASLQGDEGFMDKLSKAIKRTRPRRPAEKFDDLRFMTLILEQAKPLTEIPAEELYKLLEEELQLYSGNDEEDSRDGFRKFIQRRRRPGT
ncbi:MAG: hypothetical protein ABW090_09255 [Sedimenticola sp.]